jgi:AcrR family transcriptional regulator
MLAAVTAEPLPADPAEFLAEPGPEPGQPAGLRERKKLATRKALGIAAMHLAVERGLDSVHVDDIAGRAGVSPRTFNNYFSSKYEAICCLAMVRGQLMADALRARPPGEPLWDAVTHAVMQQHDAEEAPDKDWIAGVRLVTSSPALQGEYLKSFYLTQRVLAEAIAERTGTTLEHDMYPRIMAGAVTAAIQVAMERWLFADPPVPLAPLMRQALRHLTEDLPPPLLSSELPC